MMRALVLFFVLSYQALAATWYVNNETGDNSRAGTSDGTSWKHVPGDPAADGLAASTVINSGDTILIKDDTDYVLTAGAIVFKSGVTYDSYGSGVNPRITNNYVAGTAMKDDTGGRSNVTIRNLWFNEIGGYADNDAIYDGIDVTEINATTDTVTTATAHGFAVGDRLHFTMDGVPASVTGVAATEAYRYVKAAPTATTFTMQWYTGSPSTLQDYDITTVGSGVFKVFETVRTPSSGNGIVLNNASDNILIEDCAFSYLGQWRRIAPMDGTNSITGYGIKLESNNGVTIRDCTFEHMKTAIEIKSVASAGPVENILVENCIIDKFGWGIDVAPRSTGAILRDITIRGCTIRNKAYYDQSNWLGFGDSVHTDGIFLRAASIPSTWERVVLDGCTFYSDISSGGGTADVFISQGPSVRIQNCLFLQGMDAEPLAVGYGKLAGMTQVIEVFNNTFASSKRLFRITPDGNSVVTANRVDVRNNLFLENTSLSTGVAARVLPTNFPECVWDYNLYWKLADINATNLFSTTGSGGFKTFSQWRSSYPSLDANAVLGNPLLASITGARSTWQVYPLEGSPAIGAGENLSAFFTTDFTGTTRPASGPWTIGAYSAAYTPPTDSTAPTLLSATIGSTGGTGTLVFDEPVQGVDLAHYALSTGATLGGLSGSGTTWTFTISPVVQQGQTVTLAYTSGAGRTRDLSDNLLATFSGAAVTNNSLEPTPDPPFAPRRGGASGQVRPFGR